MKKNSVQQRVPKELVDKARLEGLSTSAYLRKLMSENDLLKTIVTSKKSRKNGGFGGLQI